MDALEFPWETLRSVVGGHSPLDVRRLTLRDEGEAEAFLECYGYDWTDPSHREQLDQLRTDAVSFLEGRLLGDPGDPEVPPGIAGSDVRRLLMLASRPVGADAGQLWSCALLRVMHAAAHARSALDERFGAEVRGQILGRIEPHLHRVDGELVLGQGADAVPLVRFEARPAKSLESVTMKLLHRVENVAEEVLDRVGVRFVTRSRLDALFVVRYLRARNVILFANVIPTRSRNTMVDLDLLRAEIARLDDDVAAGRVPAGARVEELRRRLEAMPYPEVTATDFNPHSSREHRGLKFTSRQLIRSRLPGLSGGDEELRFFFPFEIQVTDEASHESSRSGRASHERYKARQRDAVRRRVLGRLLG